MDTVRAGKSFCIVRSVFRGLTFKREMCVSVPSKLFIITRCWYEAGVHKAEYDYLTKRFERAAGVL